MRPEPLPVAGLPRAMALKNLALTVLVAVVAAMLAATPARALTLLTEENPPFSFTEKGKVQGSAAEIVRDMAARAGVPVTVEVLPWDAAYVRAQGQRDTCLFATARLENRERLFLWVGPIATDPWAVYGKADFALPIKSVKELAPYKIGTVVRDAKNDFLRENGVNDLRAGARRRAESAAPPAAARRSEPHRPLDHRALFGAGGCHGGESRPTSRSFSSRTSNRSFSPAIPRPTGRS